MALGYGGPAPSRGWWPAPAKVRVPASRRGYRLAPSGPARRSFPMATKRGTSKSTRQAAPASSTADTRGRTTSAGEGAKRAARRGEQPATTTATAASPARSQKAKSTITTETTTTTRGGPRPSRAGRGGDAGAPAATTAKAAPRGKTAGVKGAGNGRSPAKQEAAPARTAPSRAVAKAPVRQAAAPARAAKKAPAASATAKPEKAAPAKPEKAAPPKPPAKKATPEAGGSPGTPPSAASSAKAAGQRRPAATPAAPQAAPAPSEPAARHSQPAAGTGLLSRRLRPVERRSEGYTDERWLNHQRHALEVERATYMEQAQALRAEAESLVEEMEPGDIQFDDESGEGGTVTVDRERDLALSAQALQAVEEIDHALAKISSGTYGICENCGRLIPKPRLEALPFARLCIDCKSGGLSRR